MPYFWATKDIWYREWVLSPSHLIYLLGLGTKWKDRLNLYGKWKLKIKSGIINICFLWFVFIWENPVESKGCIWLWSLNILISLDRSHLENNKAHWSNYEDQLGKQNNVFCLDYSAISENISYSMQEKDK